MTNQTQAWETTGINTDATQQQQSQQKQKGQQGPTTNPGTGLAELFNMASMAGDNRNIREVGEVQKELKELYEHLNNSTTSEIHRKITPAIEVLTSAITPTLPGLAFHMVYGDTLYVAAALFSNANLTISSERINITNGGVNSQVSIPVPPAQYANKVVVDNLRTYYTKVAQNKGINHVRIINMRVVDLEMLNHEENPDVLDRSAAIARDLAASWEEAILTSYVVDATKAGVSLVNPFKTPSNPYGRDKAAEARVSAVSSKVSRDGTLSSANMEVITSTVNSGSNNSWDNSQEICRTTATVQLCGITMQEHMAVAMSQEKRSLVEQFMGANFGGSPYPNGYRPLRPVITINDVMTGEMLNNHGGLHAYMFGLYTLMTTNNNYVFAEALRRSNVGCRGNLSDLEVRISQMLAASGLGAVQGRVTLDSKTVQDTDFVNQWIRQNVSPHATFQVNLISSGGTAPIHNFMFRLASKNNVDEVKTIIAVIDSMTNNAMSNQIDENARTGRGWTTKRPVLIPTSMLEVNGLATYSGKKHSTQELDEMMISHIKGKNGATAIESYLSTKYGVANNNEDVKQRSQRLRIEMHQSIYDGAVHINGFSQSMVWAPDFMAELGKAMDSIGTMTVANNLGSWRNNSLVYAPGVGLATNVSVGADAGTGMGIGQQFNLGHYFG